MVLKGWKKHLLLPRNQTSHGETETGQKKILYVHKAMGARGGVVVKALLYKPAGREFDSRWCHWNFSVT